MDDNQIKMKQKLSDIFFKVEEEQKFFDIKIYGIKIWHHLRWCIYAIYMSKLKLECMDAKMTNELCKIRISRFQTIKQFIQIHGGSGFVQYLPFFAEKRDVLCVLFPVRRKNGRFDEEVYVDKYYSQIKTHTYYALEWSPRICHRSENPQTDNIRYTSDDLILAFFGKREKIDYKKICRQFYKLVLYKLERGLDIHFTTDEKKLIYQEIFLNYYKRNAYMRYYKFILKQICPKVILFYNGAEYYTQLLVEAGKKYGIKTVEIQHGLFGLETSYRHLPEQGVVTVSDYMLTFGEIFNDLLDTQKIRAFCVGRPDIFQKVKKYEKRKILDLHKDEAIDRKKQLLFISSCDGVIDYLYQIWDEINYDKYEVCLKLHPGDLPSWKKKYPFLVKNDKIKVIGVTKKDIYYWISKADYIIGGWSTAIYEALPFPAVKILIDEALAISHYLINKKYVLGVTENNSLLDLIDQIEKGDIVVKQFEADDYLMYSEPIDRMDNVIDEIIADEVLTSQREMRRGEKC